MVCCAEVTIADIGTFLMDYAKADVLVRLYTAFKIACQALLLEMLPFNLEDQSILKIT